MKTGLVNHRINPIMDDGSVMVRRARKQHTCWGGHAKGVGRVRCQFGGVIAPKTVYIEYCGESPLYQSGHRYHVECAAEQGLTEPLVPYVKA